MRIVFRGRTNKQFRESVRDACGFYLHKLGLSKKKLNNVTVIFKLAEMKGDYGSCVNTNHPKTFEITIHSKQDRKGKFKTLAHEIVHLKQWLTGEMRDRVRGDEIVKTYWKGELWRTSGNELDDYYDSPWEIEAYGKEEGLYSRWMDHVKRKKRAARLAKKRK
jgi:hypothetical protein